MIDSTIAERRQTRRQALDEVTGSFGGPQTLIGPVLSVPTVARVRDGDGRVQEIRIVRHVMPETLHVDARADIEVRRRGIFDVPLFVTGVTMEGQFRLTDALVATAAGRAVLWDEAELCVGLGDPRAIREATPVRVGDAAVAFEPGPGACEFVASGIHAPLHGKPGDVLPFTIKLNLGGSGRLAFVPGGSATTVRVEAPWAAPSFDGAFLPRLREVRSDGFSASWRVLHLGRNFPVAFDHNEVAADRLAATAFGVSFLSPVDTYRTTERAVKYQLLFLGLTATMFLLFELLSGLRVHPVQVLLIGLALCLFYLLLLSLSEHVGFTVAYVIAGSAITVVVGGYGCFVLGRARRGAALGGVLAALYAFLFVLLNVQDYALLVGSLGLFVVLALVMLLTRRIDWYGPAEEPAATSS
jgi:inner membrane protein